MKAKSLLSAAIITLASVTVANAQALVTLIGSDTVMGSTSFNTGDRWSDGQPPHSGADYLVADNFTTAIGSRRLFRTPEGFDAHVFLGDSLTISNANVNLKGGGNVTIGDFRLYGCRIAQGIADPINIHGTTTVHGTSSDPSRFSGSNNRVTRLHGALQGSGELSVDTTESESGSFFLELRGDNTGFTGGIRVLGPHELRLHHPDALGGAALRLVNGGTLAALITPAMTLDATRSITLENGGTLRAADNTLTVDTPIAGTGGLTVRADGRVIMNAPMTYSGDTTIVNGSFRVTPAFTLPAGSRIVMKPGGTRNIEGDGFIENLLMEGGNINPATGSDCGTLTVSNLVMAGGALRFDIGADGTTDFIRVTGSISNALATPIPVRPQTPFTNECPLACRLLTAPNLAGLGPASFALRPEFYGLPEGTLDLIQDGSETFLTFSQARPVILATADNLDAENGFQFGTYWSDSLPPDPGNDYLSINRLIRTPGADEHTFAGRSLTLGGPGADLRTKCRRTIVNDLRLHGGRVTQGTPPRTQYLAGNATVHAPADAPFNFEIETEDTSYLSDPRSLVIESTLAGAGALRFRAHVPQNDLAYGGHFILAADNTAFTGPVTVIGARNVELHISHENNLGGNPAAFSASHLTLASNAILRATAPLTLDDPNRGITLNPGGGILRTDAGAALTVALPIAGAGRLTLRGPAPVTLSGANTHTGGTVIDTNATVETRAPTALGAGSVTFLSGATLRIPHDPAALPHGIRLSGPLTVEDGPLPVTPLLGGAPFPKQLELPLFLLTSENATVASADIAPQGKPAGHTVTVETRAVDDGGTLRTQVYAKYRWGGMILMLQ